MSIEIKEIVEIPLSSDNHILFEPKLSENALRVLASRYLLRDENLNIIENPKDLFFRVATVVAGDQYRKAIKYYNLMASLSFLPNSPTLMNAGTRMNQLSACFVLDIEDDLKDIMNTATECALIFQSGGGVGINYTKIRHDGAVIKSTMGKASGPISFMKIVDSVSEVVKQGGKRRGANMGILEYSHPDIERFITAKTKPGVLENFNLSVLVDDKFMSALIDNEDEIIINNRVINVAKIFNLITESAHSSAEPALLFLENGNIGNPFLKERGYMRTTNPCGEQWLYPYESCNLGSINLAQYVDGGYIDVNQLEKDIRLAVRFLDSTLDVSRFPLNKIRDETLRTRRIGLGVMGLADLLYELALPYNNNDGYSFMHHIAELFSYFAIDESINISREKGPFPAYEESTWAKGEIPLLIFKSNNTIFPLQCDWDYLKRKIDRYGIRNSFVTTIAPTGSLSMIADCSPSIEPNFALVYKKNVAVGDFYYIHKSIRDRFDEKTIQRIAENYGSLKGIINDEIIESIYVVATDLHYKEHLVVQAIWQRFIQNAISKTINLPFNATVEDVRDLFILAWKLKLKGVTIYRDGSRSSQVINFAGKNERELKASNDCNELIEKLLRSYR